MSFITNTLKQNIMFIYYLQTDSLVYEIETNGVYENFYRDKNLFDFSDYPEDSKFFDLVNKKVIGNMEDEVKGKIIHEIVGLKSKMYSLAAVDGEEIKKAKGVNKDVVENTRHKKYLDVLFNKKII